MAAARGFSSDKLTLAVAAGIVAGYVGYLVQLFVTHGWIVDANSRPLPTDFMSLWTAGHLALRGGSLSAYEPHLRHAAQLAVVGHSFHGYFDFAYPPIFLFVVAALATLPYASAFLIWIGLTLALYAATIAAITRCNRAIIVALAAPWTFAVVEVGQTGFLTAALIGTVLLNLERRAVIAGVALGLLAYKPQFGLLFPLALAAGGYWRVFGWACLSAAIAFALAGIVFEFETFAAFVHQLPASADALLRQGGVGFNKLQSVYGITRWLGGADGTGWTAQAIVTAGAAIAVVLLWRSRAAFDVKAAGLCAATLLATPYVFAYDLPLLAVGFAFLFRERRFDIFELFAIAAALVFFLAFALFAVPFALFSSVALAVMILRRLSDVGRST
jgi:glycosyl transferase family 87